MDVGPSSLAKPGQIIAGRYRIEKLLAKGGSGAVFVAEQLKTDARVALKLLLPHILEAEDARRRFEFEARVAGRVQSEFIVRTIDAGVDEETSQPFLAMELLEGHSFAERVRRLGPWPPADVALHMSQLAMGLDKAHAHKGPDGKAAPIVHCDLKPENLFLATREDGVPVTKILDFGVAKVVSDTLAITRGVVGSPLYIAYEQLTSGTITPRTDVWAMGLIAFFMLAGTSYWRAASAEHISVSAIFAEVLNMTIVAPTERAKQLGITPGWTETFDTWFLRCVNREQSARFQSAGAAADALTESLLGPEGATASFRSRSIPIHTTGSEAAIETTDRILPVSSERITHLTLSRRNIAGGAVGAIAIAIAAAAILGRDNGPVDDEPSLRSSHSPEPNPSPAPAPPPQPAPTPLTSVSPPPPSASVTVNPPAPNAVERRAPRPQPVVSAPRLDRPEYSER
jgi:serine/threonine-protein kinase